MLLHLILTGGVLHLKYPQVAERATADNEIFLYTTRTAWSE